VVRRPRRSGKGDNGEAIAILTGSEESHFNFGIRVEGGLSEKWETFGLNSEKPRPERP
jgi:hypothetical protein